MSAPARSQKTTDIVRVLRALARYQRGITPIDFSAPHVIDGGKPMMRLGARICDLRNAGAPIRTDREPNRVARYRLTGPLPDHLRTMLAMADDRAAAEAAEARRDAEMISRAMDDAAEAPQCAIFDDLDDGLSW